MCSRRNLCVGLLTGVVLLHSVPARADWWLTPFAGTAFGGSVPDGPRLTGGVAAAWTGSSWLGFEIDAAGTTDFFKISDTTSALFDKSRVTTIMANALVTSPHAWGAGRFRPYGVAGLGAFRTRIGEDDGFIRVKDTRVGLTLGGGVIGMFEDHFGVRADLRYLRNLQHLESDSEFFSLGDGHVDFWRGTVGAVFRF